MELSFHLAHGELALQQGRGAWGTPTAATALGTGLAQLWVSPVPGQLPWLTQHVPEPCSGSLPQQQDAACSHSSLNPLGRQLAARVWDWKGREGCPWLPRSADCAGFFPDLPHLPGQGWVVLSSHALQRNELCLPPCREKKWLASLFFFTLKALQKPPFHVTVGF